MKFMNMGDLIVTNVHRYPENTALVYRDLRLTYRELNERINRLAHHLMGLGVRRGDRVSFLFHNSNQFVEIFFATLKIGAIAVPVNWRNVPREMKWTVDSSRSKIFIYSEAFSQQVDQIKTELPTVEHLICCGREGPSKEHSYEELVRTGPAEEPEVEVGLEDKAYIIYTGGTTGTPKGVVHTHGSSIFDFINGALRIHISDPDEVTLTQIPMFHGAGIFFMKSTLAVGGKLVIVETFDVREILTLIEREKATLLVFLPPATYLRLLDAPNIHDVDVSSVQKMISAVAGFPKHLMLRLFDTFSNAEIYYGWAQSETGNGGISLWVTRDMVEKDLECIKSVGIAQTLTSVRLLAPDGREVPQGETGEAYIRAPSNMLEYFDQPELTAKTLINGWVKTGDLLRRDQEGYYYFMGRSKDMIKSGGENVFAEEVEKVIMSHPAVEYCAVIGVPDLMLGEKIMAIIKPREGFAPTEEEIVEHTKTYLAGYKKPRRIVFTEDFPISDMGKVQKFMLREKYSEEL